MQLLPFRDIHRGHRLDLRRVNAQATRPRPMANRLAVLSEFFEAKMVKFSSAVCCVTFE